MSSARRTAPQRSMKTGSVGSMLCEACGPEVFDLTGAGEPADEFDPGRALARRTVASSQGESTRGRFTLSARPGSHVNGGVVMDVLHPRCCGLDVHKSSISACILLRASFWRDDPGTAGVCRMATAARRNSGSDGIQRRLLETSLEHSGGTVHGSFGKCTAH